MKKMLSIFVAPILLCSCLVSCNKGGNETEGLEYFIQDDGSYWISKGTASSLSEIAVPSSHNGKPVTGVVKNGFSGCAAKKIVLPKTIKTISNLAFSSCNNLQQMEFPEGVETIGEEPFFYSPRLFYVSFPSTLKKCKPDSIFYDDINLVEICNKSTFEITKAGFSSPYSHYETIESIITDDSNKHVSLENDFYMYKNGDTSYLLDYNGQSESITLPETGSYSLHSGCFYESKVIDSVIVPSNVKTVGQNAFEYSSITKLTLSYGISYLDKYIIWGTDMTSINFTGTIAQWKSLSKKEWPCTNTDKYVDVVCSDGTAKYESK